MRSESNAGEARAPKHTKPNNQTTPQNSVQPATAHEFRLRVERVLPKPPQLLRFENQVADLSTSNKNGSATRSKPRHDWQKVPWKHVHALMSAWKLSALPSTLNSKLRRRNDMMIQHVSWKIERCVAPSTHGAGFGLHRGTAAVLEFGTARVHFLRAQSFESVIQCSAARTGKKPMTPGPSTFSSLPCASVMTCA